MSTTRSTARIAVVLPERSPNTIVGWRQHVYRRSCRTSSHLVFGRWKYVVDCFGFTILNLSLGDQWLSSSSEQKTFKAFAKWLLGEVTQRFKEVARLIVKDAYSLRVPLGFHNSISALWEARVAELLVNWSFVDAQTTVVSFVLVLQDHDRLTPPLLSLKQMRLSLACLITRH
jgi:hypothetical protein